MQIGPRYKKARYLGAPIFRKTQSQKFAMRSQRKTEKRGRGRGGRGEFGRQLLEKQKARYSYGVSGRQFSNYVRKALQAPGNNVSNLIGLLESRLDNAVMKAGFAPTRSAARQLVSHGHATLNGRRVTVPSMAVKVGDRVGIRPGSAAKGTFAKLDESLNENQPPKWLSVDAASRLATVTARPSAEQSDLLFDVQSVLEFYTR